MTEMEIQIPDEVVEAAANIRKANPAIGEEEAIELAKAAIEALREASPSEDTADD